MTGPRWGRRVVVTLVSVLLSSLLGVLGGVAVLNGRTAPDDPSAPEPPPVAARPSDTVRRYLEALAAADAGAALAEAATQPADRTLLTDEVLRASQQIAPLSAITVPDTDAGSSVEASYRLGEEQVTRRFRVAEVPGGYQLETVAATLDVSRLRTEALPLTVAGTDVAGDSVTLFPGVYAVETGNEYLAYGSGQLLVKDPDAYLDTSDLALDITEEGVTAFTELVEAHLDKCLASSSPEPKGCPFAASVSSSYEVKKGSGSWEADDELLAGFEPRLDYEDPTVATAYVSGQLTFSYRYTSDFEDGTQDGEIRTYLGADYSLDLDSEPLEVTAG
ncbi:hypothetical protein [Auraticoccus cholistanensis]|uniref:hypothetical protein n=1 Tax=Auraticoccus cholistanensis TaxID=2656650 RepID=UPI0018D201E1|nr:hypothetical protein [Auraticoccus cholistanensis]